MSGFGNNPFQFNPNGPTNTTSATSSFNSPSLVTNSSSFSSPFGNRPSFGINSGLGSTDVGFSNFPTAQSVTQTGSFSTNSSVFRGDSSMCQSSGSFKSNSPSKIFGAHINSIQMPRPSSQWSEQKPFGFAHSSSSNLLSNASRHPNQVGFGFSNVSSQPSVVSTFPFSSTQSNSNQLTNSTASSSTASFSFNNRFDKTGPFESNKFRQQIQPQPASAANNVFGTFNRSENANVPQPASKTNNVFGTFSRPENTNVAPSASKVTNVFGTFKHTDNTNLPPPASNVTNVFGTSKQSDNTNLPPPASKVSNVFGTFSRSENTNVAPSASKVTNVFGTFKHTDNTNLPPPASNVTNVFGTFKQSDNTNLPPPASKVSNVFGTFSRSENTNVSPSASAATNVFGTFSRSENTNVTPSASAATNVFGTFSEIDKVNDKQEQTLLTTNLWNRSTKPQIVEQLNETKSPDEITTLQKSVSNDAVQERGAQGDYDSESTRPPSSRPIRRTSVTSLRKSPGLFAKAVGGLKQPSVKPISAQVPKVGVDGNKEMKPRRSSVKSSDGISISPEELATFTSIVCKGIPDDLNNKPTLLQHFGRFGIVKRIVPSLSKHLATVTYQNHESALAAKTSGKIIRSDREPLSIFWLKSHASNYRADSLSTRAHTVKRNLNLPESQSTRQYGDDGVNDELKSMSSTATSLIPPNLLERPKDQNRSPKKSSHSDVPLSLRSVQETSCKNVHDKYVVLDNVDKLLRLGMGKQQATLATAKAIVGTCQDMCPEKERYMREDRKQLHPYEMNGDGICDHRKAIKEYSRSSADQDEPLPHELRPPRVLSMTMHYLICNIMDIFENSSEISGSAAEWYDFVWNRTRSIRKDITQQHLCDHVTVEVIEMCTRFHIHCSARLCEEDMMTFDQRHNNENLTDCLQTLKHMYVTLRAKGQPCMNEAEFVAYDMLLHLNEGDVIRQNTVQHPDAQHSPEILLSLECASTISVNNYARFFKLVRMSPYLIACILQRYFSQIRNKGFQSFMKAYCYNTSYQVQFPVSKLMTLFGFDDLNEVLEFASLHNLQVYSDFVILDKGRFAPPEKVPLRRAKLLIESKRTCSVGEIVYGGSTPENPVNYYEPNNSFDDSGFLKREAIAHFDILDQVKPRKVGSDGQGSADVVIESIVNEIIAEGVYQIIEKWATSHVRNCNILVQSVFEISSVFMNEVCSSMIRDVAQDILKIVRTEELKIRLQKEAEEFAMRQLIQKVKEESAMELNANLIEEIVSREINKVVQYQLREELDIYKKQCIESATQQIAGCYCQQWACEIVMELVAECHSEATEYRTTTLDRVARKMTMWKAAEFCYKWKTIIIRRKRLRSSMELFPSSILCSTYMTKHKGILNSNFSLKLTSPLEFENNRNQINRLLDMKALSDDLEEGIRKSNIDLVAIARHCSVSVTRRYSGEYNRQQHVSWKLILTLQNAQNDNLTQWLLRKFMQPNTVNQPNRLQGEVVSFVNYDNKCIPSVAISVKFIQPRKGYHRTLLKGTQGIILVIEIPSPCDLSGFEDICRRESNSLNSLLSQMGQVPPILFLIVGNGNLSNSELRYQLDLIFRQGMRISAEFFVIQLCDRFLEPDCTHKLTEGLKWLKSQSPQPPFLHIDDVSHYINKAVTEYYFPLINQFKAEYISSLEVLEALISAFNHLIKHLANCASDSSLHKLSWPPSEFAGRFADYSVESWNSSDTLRNLELVILSYRLPLFNQALELCSDWPSMCSVIWDYIQNFQYIDWSHRTFLYAKLQRLLENSKEKYEEICSKFYIQPWQVFPWSKIFKIFVDYHLSIIDINPIEVVYDPFMVRSFTKSEAWDLISLHKSDTIPLSLMKCNEERSIKIKSKRKVPDVFSKVDSVSDLKRSCLELQRQLQIEREKSVEYNKFLQNALKEK